MLQDYITHYIHALVIVIHLIQLNEGLRNLSEGKLDQEVFPGDMGMPVAYTGILFGGGGVSTNSVEDRENRDLGEVAP